MKDGGESCLFFAGCDCISDSDEDAVADEEAVDVLMSFRDDAGGLPILREGL